jgi:peptidyl-prolyl cis-trans isomerase B (cyclophilin B)
MQFRFSTLLFILLLSQISFAQIKLKAPKKSKFDTLVTISTTFGEMKIILYESTPKHRSNFLKLTKEGFYNGLLFHRVIKDFMIQGGDPESKNAKPSQQLGSGNLGYMVDAEFRPELIHKKGALAAARNNNPQKASSSCQFYIVQGKKLTDAELAQVERNNKIKYTEAQKEVYKTIGGTAFLDNNYTVYGEIIKGMEVLEQIAAQPTAASDRPQKDIEMSIKTEKISKKKLTKLYGYQYE